MNDHLVFVVGLVFALILLVAPAQPARAQHCQTEQCFTAECWWVAPGHRRCRRVCRCWYHAPRHQPPQHEQPRYAVPAHIYVQSPTAWPPFSPEIAIAGGALLLIALFAAIAAGSSADQLNRDLMKVERDSATTRSLANAARDATEQIDRHIQDTLGDHFQRGRDATDREWTGE